MAVFDPLRVVITNFPDLEVRDNRLTQARTTISTHHDMQMQFLQATEVEAPNIPRDPSKGTHKVSFDRVIYIEQSDFREVCVTLFPEFSHQLVYMN